VATQTSQSMISEVSICNQALSWVGANLIASMDEPNSVSEWCKNNYPFLRDAVLEERMWTFAIGKAVSTTANKDDWDSYYMHRLPEEWLAVYYVYTDQYGNEAAVWRREGEYIVSPSDTIYMLGVRRIVDTNKFSNLFVQALAARLACDMAIPFAEDKELQANMWTLYAAKLEEAGRQDRQGRNDFVNNVCEQALSLIGADRIVDNMDQNTVSEMLRAGYETARDSVLSHCMWSFARTRTDSTALGSYGPSEYLHNIPTDWLKVVRIFEDQAMTNAVDWIRTENGIVTSIPDVYMEGIKRITTPNSYSPEFVSALAARMAADMAFAVTQDKEFTDLLWKAYEYKIKQGSQGDRQGRNKFLNSICDQAMTWIGADRLVDNTNESMMIEWLEINYEPLRDSVLEERTWSFATTRVLSESDTLNETSPAYYEHDMPEEWLKVFRVYSDSELANQIDWYFEGGKVLCRHATVYLWGLIKIEDINLYPKSFVQALAARVAAELAYTVTKSRTLAETMWMLYSEKLKEAAARDGAQGRSEKIGPSKKKPGRLVGRRFS
jgi:hypothetical protein